MYFVIGKAEEFPRAPPKCSQGLEVVTPLALLVVHDVNGRMDLNVDFALDAVGDQRTLA
jgi:hypothetical protein